MDLTPYHEAICQSIRAIGYALGSAASAVAAFMVASMPYLQWISFAVAILAGLASIRASLATHNAIKKNK